MLTLVSLLFIVSSVRLSLYQIEWCQAKSCIHKKGNPYDPDNYRSICIGSCLGKVYANILLHRLAQYRRTNYPDAPNQLGFCENAQTADHILTISTIVEKYCVKRGKYIYACFVDFSKAFDSVCREALLYKISSLGIGGRFMSCIQHMYTKSSTRIKLIKKLSEQIDINIGTEQGNPLSPELFKLYLRDLSTILNDNTKEDKELSVPHLNNQPISHLLWADDLVLLATDSTTLQSLLNSLAAYCSAWGLKINVNKTSIMIFNKQGKMIKPKKAVTLGEITLQQTRSYCYLGITLTPSGSFAKAFTWTLQQIARDPCESAHLQFLKWTLGVNKKCSNIACWGDTGRLPIGTECIEQVLTYKRRLEDNIDQSSIVYHTMQEQKQMELRWFSSLTQLENKFSPKHPTDNQSIVHVIKTNIHNEFIEKWYEGLNGQPKLRFYREIKTTFGIDSYLDIKTYTWRRALTRLRSSSHTLNIETGRYKDASNLQLRECVFCRNVMGHKVIEDEVHLLATCPLYHSLRTLLPCSLKSSLLSHDLNRLSTVLHRDELTSRTLGKFIDLSFAVRQQYLKDLKIIKSRSNHVAVDDPDNDDDM